MASISIVDGQGDNLNLHINAIKNNCSKTFDGKSLPDLDNDKSASQTLITKEYCETKIVNSVENGGNPVEDKVNSETQVKICPNKPCEAEELSASCTLLGDQSNTINNINSEECCSSVQPVNSDKTENCNECSQEKPYNLVELDSKVLSENCEFTELNISEKDKLDLVPQKLDLLDIADIIPTHSDDTEISVLNNSYLEAKDNIISDDSLGDQLKGCTKLLTNHLEDGNASSKSDAAVVSESVVSCLKEDNMQENQMKTDDASAPLNSSEDDLLNEETENQENTTLCENVDPNACAEDMEMSDIKIAESLSISDSDYVSDVKDVNMYNKDSNEKGLDTANAEIGVDECNSDNLIDSTDVNSENKHLELDIVILETGSVAELANESIISDVDVNDSKELTEPKSDIESFSEPAISHSIVEDNSVTNTTLLGDNLLNDNQTENVSEENFVKEISLNEKDKLCDGLDSKDDGIDTEDDILFMDDEETTVTNSKPQKYSFKNILKKPREDSTNSKFPTEDINSIIIDDNDDEMIELVKESEDSECKEKVDLAKSEDDLSKTEKNRKRSLLELNESNSSKRHKQDSSLIETKDAVMTDTAVGNCTSDEKKITTKEGVKEEMYSSSIQTSSEVLQAFMTLHLRAFMKNQKQIHTEKLNRRTRNMQSACSLWKETAKHLEKSVVELTALSNKLDKQNKALKNLSHRNIGIQVNETKAKTPSPAATPSAVIKNMPANSTNATPTQPQSAKTKHLSNNVNQSVNKNQPNTTPQKKIVSKPAALPVTVPKTSPSQRQASTPSSRVQPQIGRTPSSSQGNNLLDSNNLIDLTDEDDNSKKAQKPVSQTTPKPAVAKNILPSPANGYNTSLQVGASDILYTAGNQVALNPVQNSQLITLPPLAAGSPFHLIPINNNVQAANKTPMYALLPGPRPALSIASTIANTRSMPVVSTNMAPITNTTTAKSTTHTLPPSPLINKQHPAPLPSNQDAGNAPPNAKKRPPKPGLKISKVNQGIVLSWNMPSLIDIEKILSYQLFAYQETENSVAKYSLWKKVGDVKALPLPMACTLTQFQEGNRYHFAVRAVDQYGRCGEYSDPSSIFLGPKT